MVTATPLHLRQEAPGVVAVTHCLSALLPAPGLSHGMPGEVGHFSLVFCSSKYPISGYLISTCFSDILPNERNLGQVQIEYLMKCQYLRVFELQQKLICGYYLTIT
jgi:hypothetical protein